MRRVVGGALAGTAIALTFVATASADNGSWSGTPGIEHLHFQTKPIDVRPGQNTIDNVIVPSDEKPSVDGFIVRMKPDLQYLDGTVPPVDVIHLHHGVWVNLSGHSDAASRAGLRADLLRRRGEDDLQHPQGYGYAYKASDAWALNQMIHNNTANATKVRLVWDLDFIPASSALAKTVTAVKPIWMDVVGKPYPVFNTRRGSGRRGQITFPEQQKPWPYAGASRPDEYRMPYDATIVAAVGHLHPGGLRDDIDVDRPGATLPKGQSCSTVALNPEGTRAKRRCVTATPGIGPSSVRIFRSQAHYFDKAGPVSWDASLSIARPDWRVSVKAGDTLRISSTYESRLSSWYENMGIVLLYVVPNAQTGRDPFAKAVDWHGVLTHGHLPENDDHGGQDAGLADPRKVASGPLTTTIDIRRYTVRPGDLTLLTTGAKVPTVRQGQSLTFVNEDDTSVEWHSITTCAAPCNRTFGISYPLADGQDGVQFDSGQLGFGPAPFAPVANTDRYVTPANLPPNTYTYFCRIHNWMRGSFRVVAV